MSAGPAPASAFFEAWRERLRFAGRGGPVLDLACGRGRHALPAARDGLPVLGLDRDPERLAALVSAARGERLPVRGIRADLESAHGIPVLPGSCGSILVFRFLSRRLAASIAGALRPGGFLLYETFTRRQPELGWGPRNPDFLLAEGELRALFAPHLEVLSYWEGIADDGPRPEAAARLAARRPG